MAQKFLLRLLTPYQSVFEDQVEAISLPGELGEFGILYGHTKFAANLVPGVVRYVQNGQTHRLVIGGGYAEVFPGGMTVLADSLERPEQIEIARAEASRKRALDALKDKATLTSRQVTRWEDRLSRAENRLKAAKR